MFHITEEIPAKVSINEAVEISKAFWDDSAKKIVNWVLNKVYENHNELMEQSKNPEWTNDFSFF
jgi:transcription termination factor NusB